jgi:hypothetical protein
MSEREDFLSREIEPDPVIEAYKKDIDRTLLRENLKRSPEERIRNAMALQRAAEELRKAGRLPTSVAGTNPPRED